MEDGGWGMGSAANILMCYYRAIMAKKKKLHKKQQRQHKQSFAKSSSAQLPVAAAQGTRETMVTSAAVVVGSGAVRAPAPFDYAVENLDLIRKDVRKVVVLAATFVLIQVLLWVLFEHTGLGSAVYSFVKI